MIETGARRREIEEVASELFHANGYAATSVRDIARALDIQGASLYAHVASKEDVLWSIVDRAATSFEAKADEAVAVTSTSSRPTRNAPASSSLNGATSPATAAPLSPDGATPTRRNSAR